MQKLLTSLLVATLMCGPAAASQAIKNPKHGSHAVAHPAKGGQHVIVQVGRDKDTEPWRVLADNNPQIARSLSNDQVIRKGSAGSVMEPIDVRDQFYADLSMLQQSLASGRLTIVSLHKGEPVGYMQAGGLRGAPYALLNCVMGIDGITAIQGLYEAKDGTTWKMTMPVACGNKAGIQVVKEVSVELPPVELVPPPAAPAGKLPPTTVVPDLQPETKESSAGAENEVLAGVEVANIPSSGTVGDTTVFRTGAIKLTREFAGYRRTWVKGMEGGSLLRLIVQGGLENIEQLSKDPNASDEHLGGRAWTNVQVHFVIKKLTLGLGAGGSYSKDGLAMVYIEPMFTFDPRYWGVEGNFNVGKAPSKETADGDVHTYNLGPYVRPLEIFHLDDRIPLNWRVGVRYRDFDLERPGFFEYSARGPRLFTKLYWEFGKRFEQDPATGWSKQKSVWSCYVQADYGLQDVELHEWINGKKTLTFKAKQPLTDAAVVFSYKW